jgi:hypothetical protein
MPKLIAMAATKRATRLSVLIKRMPMSPLENLQNARQKHMRNIAARAVRLAKICATVEFRATAARIYAFG